MMLARGVLCRLAADVPKTSTHDLPQLAHLLKRTLVSRNGLSSPAVCARSRAYKCTLLENCRSYATTTRATKPTRTVKKAVKKTAAKKTVKKTAAKKPKKKTVAKKKAKPAKKPKRVKKELTPEQKEKLAIKKYKEQALKEPVSKRTVTGWQVFLQESLKAVNNPSPRDEAGPKAIREAGARFRAFTPAEKEHYNHVANEHTAANQAEYKAWIRSHTPEQIRIANRARTALRRLLRHKQKSAPAYTSKLEDDRQVKLPLTPASFFTRERHASGDLKGVPAREALKLIANEWKALSESEKKKYYDIYEQEKIQYRKEYERAYGHPPPVA